MSATFDYNVALGKLAQATGWENPASRWRNDSSPQGLPIRSLNRRSFR